MHTFPGENSCWPGTGESLLALELQGPVDTTPGDNLPLHPEVGIDKWGEQDDEDDDEDDSIHGRAVCVPTCCGTNALINKSNTSYLQN